jgi:hypothetical protein
MRLKIYFDDMVKRLQTEIDALGTVGGALFVMNSNRELQAIFDDVLPAITSEGVVFTLNDVQPEDESNDDLKDEILASLALWMLLNSKTKAELITQTTIKIFIKITTDIEEQGVIGQEAIKEVTRQMSKRNKGRIKVISATEAHNSASKGQEQTGFILEKALQKTWISQGDARVRNTHVLANGQMQDINQPFRVGGMLMMRPSDPAGGPAETIGCRCFLRLKKIV